MKFIKQFESNLNKVVVTIVSAERNGEHFYGLYVDGKLEIADDYERITGFIDGLKWIRREYIYPLNVIEETFKVTNEDVIIRICELGDIPHNLIDLK